VKSSTGKVIMFQKANFNDSDNRILQLIAKFSDGEFHSVTFQELNILGIDCSSWYDFADPIADNDDIYISFSDEIDEIDPFDTEESYLTYELIYKGINVNPGESGGFIFQNEKKPSDHFILLWIINYAADIILNADI